MAMNRGWRFLLGCPQITNGVTDTIAVLCGFSFKPHNVGIHTHIHTGWQADRQTYTHIYTHTYMHTYIHTSIHTHKHAY